VIETSLQIDEIAALIQYHSGRKTTNGHLMTDAVKRIAELTEMLTKTYDGMAKASPGGVLHAGR
jgi:hypothetical protein